MANCWFGVIYEGRLGDMAYHAVVYSADGSELTAKRFSFRFKDHRKRIMNWFEGHHVAAVYEV